MQQVRDRAVSTRLPRAKPASPAQARSVSHGYATDELRVQKSPSDDATRRRMAQKSPYRAESAMLLRGAAGTSGAQKLVTRPTGRPEGGTTATGGAQRAEVVELGKSDAQWPGGFSVDGHFNRNSYYKNPLFLPNIVPSGARRGRGRRGARAGQSAGK